MKTKNTVMAGTRISEHAAEVLNKKAKSLDRKPAYIIRKALYLFLGIK